MIAVAVDIDDGGVIRRLNRIAAAGGHLPLKRLEVIGVRSVLRNFDMGGRPVAWAALKESTSARKGRGGANSKPLLDTGSLRNSVQAMSLPPSNLKVYSAHTKDGAPVAMIHQAGTRDGRIPARPFMVWQDEDREAIRKVLDDHLKKAV